MVQGTSKSADPLELDRRKRILSQRRREDEAILSMEHSLLDRRVEDILFGKMTDKSMLLPGLHGRKASAVLAEVHKPPRGDVDVKAHETDYQTAA